MGLSRFGSTRVDMPAAIRIWSPVGSSGDRAAFLPSPQIIRPSLDFQGLFTSGTAKAAKRGAWWCLDGFCQPWQCPCVSAVETRTK
jgi:hypothetical protein